MSLSHRQLQDFVYEFNRGNITLTICYRWPEEQIRVEDLQPRPLRESPVKIDISARIRGEGDPKIIVRTIAGGREIIT